MSDEIQRRHLHGVTEVPDANVLGPGQIRASDPLRERYIERLAEAYGYGVLTREEHEARVGAAQNAKTERHLQELESDLPDLRQHLGQVHGTSIYNQTRAWLKVPLHRNIAHIAGFPVFTLIIVLGVLLPLAYVPVTTWGLQGLLIAIFVILGAAGFVINGIAYAIWETKK